MGGLFDIFRSVNIGCAGVSSSPRGLEVFSEA
jgi:hypothetical protein